MPRRVVPIWSLPSRRSDAWSIAMCHGMIRWALPETTIDARCRCRARSRLVELRDQHLRVDDAARADHRELAGDHPARGRADLERLLADDDRVPGVRPALVAADEIRTLREQVDDLALALVAPLCADDDGRRHAPSLPDAGRARGASRARPYAAGEPQRDAADASCWGARSENFANA